jgi:transcriptional regulator with XRE-family HTH domain
MNDFDHIGDKIRILREDKNYTVKELAEKSKVSSSLISQIEHEKVSPSLNTLKRILDALDETIISLVEMEKGFDKDKSLIKKKDRIKVIVAPGCI